MGRVRTAQRVTVFGPNLSGAAQRKGELHVHKAGCDHVKHYGPGRKFGGDDNGWTFDAANEAEVVCDIYPPGDFEWDGEDWESMGVYFAPCVNFSPQRKSNTDTKEVATDAKQELKGMRFRDQMNVEWEVQGPSLAPNYIDLVSYTGGRKVETCMQIDVVLRRLGLMQPNTGNSGRSTTVTQHSSKRTTSKRTTSKANVSKSNTNKEAPTMPKTSSKTSTASKSTTSNGKRNGKPEMTREQIVVRATVLYKKHGEKVAAEKLNEEGVPTLRASRTRDNGWHSDALRGLMARTGSYVASRTPKKATPAASSKRSTTTKRASSKRASAKRTSSKRSSSKRAAA